MIVLYHKRSTVHLILVFLQLQNAAIRLVYPDVVTYTYIVIRNACKINNQFLIPTCMFPSKPYEDILEALIFHIEAKVTNKIRSTF